MQPFHAGETPTLVSYQVSRTESPVYDFAKQIQAELQARKENSVVLAVDGGYMVQLTNPLLAGLALKGGGHVHTGSDIVTKEAVLFGFTAADWAHSILTSAQEFVQNNAIDPSRHYDPVTGKDLELYFPATVDNGWTNPPRIQGGPSVDASQPPYPAPAGKEWNHIGGGMGWRLVDIVSTGPAPSGTQGGFTVNDLLDAFCAKVVLVNGLSELAFRRKP